MRHYEPTGTRRGLSHLACGLGLLLLVSGCLTSPNIALTRHYALRPEIVVDAAERIDLTLGMRPLFASRVYGLPMAYLDSAHQMAYRDKAEWAEPPAAAVTRALNDALAATGRFADVGNAADMARPDLMLTGELRIFQENRTLNPPAAEIEARLELRPSRAPGALWAQTIQESIPIESDDPGAFAAAMNQALARLAARAANDIARVAPPPPETPEAPRESIFSIPEVP